MNTNELKEAADLLIAEYLAFLDISNLPGASADELIMEDGITPEQRVWLTDFIQRWDAAVDRARETAL